MDIKARIDALVKAKMHKNFERFSESLHKKYINQKKELLKRKRMADDGDTMG